ncbi:MAG: PA2778 family cysteine peptidase [Gammaproteobacteria bacterium]|nr:PA2778 family cysteine peptidase [Gammaproteobacteria bacterium]
MLLQRQLRSFSLIVSSLLLSACTTLADHVLPKQPQDQASDIVLQVPFFDQTAYYFGPAALSMIANFYILPLRPGQLHHFKSSPNKTSGLQLEMLATAREIGLQSYHHANDINSLFNAIDRQRPVIVLQNLAIDAYPVWHYAVVVGYSADKEFLLLHSGRHEYYRAARTTFENTWSRAANWSLALSPITDIPEDADINKVIAAAIDLEHLGHARAAQITYSAILKRWPDHFAAYLGLANSHMQLNEPLAASRAYRKALNLNPYSTQTLNNFAYSAAALGCHRSAVDAARCAVEMSKVKNSTVENTFNELTEKYPDARNAGRCPQVQCKKQP